MWCWLAGASYLQVAAIHNLPTMLLSSYLVSIIKYFCWVRSTRYHWSVRSTYKASTGDMYHKFKQQPAKYDVNVVRNNYYILYTSYT